jgi:Cys-rich repeat protein
MSRPLQRNLLGLPALIFALSALPLLAGCEEVRFPGCNSDAECVAKDAGPGTNICINQRCVGCRYDTDCPKGEYCAEGNKCSAVVPKPTADEKPTSWDPNSFNECARGCKERDCIELCNHRFPDGKRRP